MMFTAQALDPTQDGVDALERGCMKPFQRAFAGLQQRPVGELQPHQEGRRIFPQAGIVDRAGRPERDRLAVHLEYQQAE